MRLGGEVVEEALRKGALDDREAPVREPVEDGLHDEPAGRERCAR
jgi:hypothetical protein